MSLSSDLENAELPGYLSKLNKLAKVARTIDAGELLKFLSNLDAHMVQEMMKAASSQKPRDDIPPDGDFYDISALLSREERWSCVSTSYRIRES